MKHRLTWLAAAVALVSWAALAYNNPHILEVALNIEGPRGPVSRPGTVEYVSPVVDPSSGLREVKVLFDNADNKIQPGVPGKMIIEVKQ